MVSQLEQIFCDLLQLELGMDLGKQVKNLANRRFPCFRFGVEKPTGANPTGRGYLLQLGKRVAS
jgi:hypothetical protein